MKAKKGQVKKVQKVRTIVLADTSKMDNPDEVWRKALFALLKKMGHTEALITDESMVGDFYIPAFDKTAKKRLEMLCQSLGFKVKESDFLWEVVNKMLKAGKA